MHPENITPAGLAFLAGAALGFWAGAVYGAPALKLWRTFRRHRTYWKHFPNRKRSVLFLAARDTWRGLDFVNLNNKV
jgi:hypothetical protein